MPDTALDTHAEVHRFDIPYEALGMNRERIARGMGYSDGVLSDPFADDVDELLEEAPAFVSIQGGFRVFTPDEVQLERDRFDIDGHTFDTGRIIAGPLRGSDRLALFVATAGPGITRWSHELMDSGDILRGYFVDALGSETVERATDWLEEKIIAWSEAHGLHTTNRYSPGYCGWHVSEQHKLFDLLPEHFCNVTLTESALMQPTKSVSGIIGIGPKAKRRAYACSICDMKDCFRRNARVL